MKDLNEVYYDGDNTITISSKTPYDGIWFEFYEQPYSNCLGGNFNFLKLNKQQSIKMANRILEFWNNDEI